MAGGAAVPWVQCDGMIGRLLVRLWGVGYSAHMGGYGAATSAWCPPETRCLLGSGAKGGSH
eukprot:4636744-Prymnesium_polylepis.2